MRKGEGDLAALPELQIANLSTMFEKYVMG